MNTTTAAPEWVTDVAEFADRPIDWTGRAAVVQLAGEYTASMTEDDTVVTAWLKRGHGIEGSTKFDHMGDVQFALIAAHLDSLATIAEMWEA